MSTIVHVTMTFEELPDSGYRVPSPGDYFMWKRNGIMHHCADIECDQNDWSPAHEYRLFKVVSREERTGVGEWKTTKVRVKLFESARDVVFTLLDHSTCTTVWVARNTVEYQVGRRTIRSGDLYRVEHRDGHVTFRFESTITGKPAVAIGWWSKS